MAASMFAAMPMALAQASTTQADLVAALWPAVLLEYAFREKSHRFSSASVEWLFVSAVVALSAMTKPTSLAVMVPVGALLVWRRVHESSGERVSTALRWAAAGASGVLVGSLPLYGRLVAESRWPDRYEQVINYEPSLRGTASNLVRFGHNNIGLPREIGVHFSSFFDRLYGITGSSAGDTRYVGYGHSPTVAFGTNEDYAAQPVQFLIGGVMALLIVFVARHRRDVLHLATVLLIQLFLLVSFLKWNIWTNRLLLPVLFSLAVILGVGLGLVIANGRRLRRAAVGALVTGTVAYGLVFMASSQYRSVIDLALKPTESVFDRTFVAWPSAKADYRVAIEEVSRFDDETEVTLVLPNGNSWEYPLWKFANEDFRLNFQFVTEVPVDESREVVFVCVPACSG